MSQHATAARDAIIEAKRIEIKKAMHKLGRAIESGDDRELVYWIVPGQLAVAHRPLRYHPQYGASGIILPPDAASLIEEWVELIKVEGITSIISLMHDRDTKSYRKLPLADGDIHAYLAAQGFTIARHPYEDPAHKHTPAAEAKKNLHCVRQAALTSYDKLPKPVLIQCSAGEDRSAPVAAYIYANRSVA